MKKFSQFSKTKVRRINEADETMMQPVSGQDGAPVVANLPQNIQQPEVEGEIAGTVESNEVSTFFSGQRLSSATSTKRTVCSPTRALSPRPMPIAAPQAMAITFLTAPPICAPTTSSVR